MKDGKIVVPEGMLKAAADAYREGVASTPFPYPQLQDRWGRTYEGLLTDSIAAALRWLSEHPIVPTERQFANMVVACSDGVGPQEWVARGAWSRSILLCGEWQRHMFRAAEPEVPEAIKDLFVSEQNDICRTVNAHIVEAYRIGLKAASHVD